MTLPGTSHTVESRRELIIDRLARRGRVEVSELATELAVTEETIRRDLQALEDRGLLQRTHGGAIGVTIGSSDSGERIDDRAVQARAASGLVADSASVFLDAGPCCEALATELAGRSGIRIITASVSVALAAVMDDERAEVYVLGGSVGSDAVLTGVWAREQLVGLHIDTAFVEPSGLAPDGRLLVEDPERASLVASAISASDSVVMLGAAACLNGTGLARFAMLDAISHAVLDEGVGSSIVDQLTEAGVVIVTFDLEDAR